MPALIILGPLLLPIANQLGIDSIHYAMVILLAMGIGIFVPPIGICFLHLVRGRGQRHRSRRKDDATLSRRPHFGVSHCRICALVHACGSEAAWRRLSRWSVHLRDKQKRRLPLLHHHSDAVDAD
jgi:Tripartite ATP-independent periplasmic transporter, DctM component